MFKKLLSINNYHYRRAGAEVVYFTQNELFEANNWEVMHFAMQHPQNEESAWKEYFPSMVEFSELNSMSGRLKAAPVIIYNLEAKKKMKLMLDKSMPDIAHAHNIYHHISPSILQTLKDRGVPIVITLHDLKLACPAYKMLNSSGVCEECKAGSLLPVIKNRCLKESLPLSALIWLESTVHRVFSLYGSVDAFVVPSNFYKQKFIEWGFEPSKFHVIPNSVDVSMFTPRYEPNDEFLFFGRLAPEKGLETLIRAASLAQVSLRIIGSGDKECELKDLAKEKGVVVSFEGFLSGKVLHDAIRSCRAVVLPSEWYENAPMSLLEANVLGKLVIGADIGGIPEFINDGVTGFIYSGGEQDLAEVLIKVNALADHEVCEIGRNARNHIVDNYSHELYFKRLCELYKSLGVSV